MMNTQTLELGETQPWYRQPWPWLLMSGPAIVVVAGLFTAWLAYTRGDPLVSDDYYRQGLAAKQTIASSEYAQAMGLQADLQLSDGIVSMHMQHRDKSFLLPDMLILTMSHPTRAGLDQVVVLHREGDRYRGNLHIPQNGHWLFLIEDKKQSWRLLGKALLPAEKLSIGDVNSAAPVQ